MGTIPDVVLGALVKGSTCKVHLSGAVIFAPMRGDEYFSAKTLPVSGALLSNNGVGLLSFVNIGVITTGPDPAKVNSIITDLFTEPRSTTALPDPSSSGAAETVGASTKRPRTTVTATVGAKRKRMLLIK